MAHRILVFGLPGAGKTHLASRLHNHLPSTWINADDVRSKFDDWDFSDAGRRRQATRIRSIADECDTTFAICDFVCPTASLREIFNADTSIWLDTIQKGRFEDTNKLFEKPKQFSLQITYFYSDEEIATLAQNIMSKFTQGNENV